MRFSAPHVELVLALLRSGFVTQPEAAEHQPCWRMPGLETLPWRDVIAFASAHFVVPAISQPLRNMARTAAVPDDLIDFIEACHSANEARNENLRNALELSTQSLELRGIGVVALKGAAFLASLPHDAPAAPWRFMQDIDLLVPEQQLADAVALFHELGYIDAKTHFDPRSEAHYPPLISPCQTFSVELHTRLFAHAEHELPASDIRRDALPSSLCGERLLVPAMKHRIMHVIAHAQLHNRNFVRRRLVLKDILDLVMLERTASDPHALPAALAAFNDPHARTAAQALLAAQHLVMEPATSTLHAGHSWAPTALARLHWPAWLRRLSAPIDETHLEVYRFRRENGHVRRRLAVLRRADLMAEAAANWRFKQRQYHWR